MKALASIELCEAAFNRLTMRERVLTSVAVLTGIIALWQVQLIQPLEVTRKALAAEVSELHGSFVATSNAIDASRVTDPRKLALQQIKATEAALSEVDSKLESASAGLLPPQRMAEVIQEVLRHRRDVKLISLRSESVTNVSEKSADSGALYQHPVELIVEGRYLDILDYLRALEALHWHLYWKTLELDGTHYPLNRVRIALSTLSLDRTWLEL